MGRFVKLAKNAIQIYEEQGSSRLALQYAFRYIARRGPIALTRGLRRTASLSPQNQPNPDCVRLAVLAPGGIGDLVVTARYVRDLWKASGPFSYDLFSPQPAIAEWVFRSAPGIAKHLLDLEFETASKQYEAALFMPGFIQIRHSKNAAHQTSLGFALTQISAASADIQCCIDNHPAMDGFLAQKLQFRNITRATSLHSMSQTPYGGDRFQLPSNPSALPKFGLRNSTYVTVHNGFEVQNIVSGTQSTKCYPHFNEVILQLRRDFPDLTFVQLGSKTSKPIPSVHQNLIAKTTLEEASNLIAGAICHLDNESGLVHIASCHGTPCCVVFGPTPPDYFSYQTNINIRPEECGNCWWITNNWMDRCPRGFEEPVCTYKQSPLTVAAAASHLIRKTIGQAA